MIQARNSRRLAAVLVIGLVLGACRVPGQWFPGYGVPKPSGVHVVSPTNATQAPASGEIALAVQVDSHLDADTLRVWIVPGWPEPTASVEITNRLSFNASGATAQLHAVDLTPGLVTIKARATRPDGTRRELGGKSSRSSSCTPILPAA